MFCFRLFCCFACCFLFSVFLCVFSAFVFSCCSVFLKKYVVSVVFYVVFVVVVYCLIDLFVL